MIGCYTCVDDVIKIRPVELYVDRGYILCNCMFTSGVCKDTMHTIAYSKCYMCVMIHE